MIGVRRSLVEPITSDAGGRLGAIIGSLLGRHARRIWGTNLLQGGENRSGLLRAVARRVRVRDDGRREASHAPADFGDYADADAVVLLGDPGMGKSILFAQHGAADAMTVRRFMLAPRLPHGPALHLDGLDEYRRVEQATNASDAIAAALVRLGKPRFRISCRAADWFGELDQDVIREASPSGRVIVLELLPLSDENVRAAIDGCLDDPDGFVQQAQSFGLAPLLSNPQTLELFVRAWRSGRHPRNKFEAYDFGITDLLKETAAAHQLRGALAVSDASLRRAAGAAFATMLLSNVSGVARTATVDGPDVIQASSVPVDEPAHLDVALGRRVFTSPQNDVFEPAHRTIAEFLAGEDLARRIRGGLPVTRVLALMCGPDGSPIRSLRGLFGWLMCHLGAEAERHVGRDPYAAANYGDPSVLPPAVQKAIWHSLAGLLDPWFLADEQDRGSFVGLANASTAPIIQSLVDDPSVSPHLQVAAFEALASAGGNLGLRDTARSHAVGDSDNTWLRDSALRAFARVASPNDLIALDDDLAARTDDSSAVALRAALMGFLPRDDGHIPRVVSVLRQHIADRAGRHVLGHLLPLYHHVRADDLDPLLDVAETLLPEHGYEPVELRSLFKDWLVRRLGDPSPLDPARLALWLPAIRRRATDDVRLTEALRARIQAEPALFASTVDAAIAALNPLTAAELGRFLRGRLPRIFTSDLWPLPAHSFFLDRARQEPDGALAACYFWQFLASIPGRGFTLAEAEAADDLVASKPDLAAALGDWTTSELEEWRIDDNTHRVRAREEAEQARAGRAARLTANLPDIVAGREVGALGWAAWHYADLGRDTSQVGDAESRLASLSSRSLAGALVDGMRAHLDATDVLPSADAIFQAERDNAIPASHYLLIVSAALRWRDGLEIPAGATEALVAAAIVGRHKAVRLEGAAEAVDTWLIEKLQDANSPARLLLLRSWQDAIQRGGSSLPRLDELGQRCAPLLAELAKEVLEVGPEPSEAVLQGVIRLFLLQNVTALLLLAQAALAKTALPGANRGAWLAARFVADPAFNGLAEELAHLPDNAAWATIDVLRGDDFGHGPLSLSPEKRVAVILSLGARFPNAAMPEDGAWGRHHGHDAADFIITQIRSLAADHGSDVDRMLGRLASDPGLASYRDLIRHFQAERARRLREKLFEAPDANHVAAALQNAAPATMSDLLALVVEHLVILSDELRGTAFEKLRSYWNEDGTKFLEPKHEPTCSGILAGDVHQRLAALRLITTVEHHMVEEKECDIVVLEGTERLLPIEVKHHYNAGLWTAWSTQLDKLYTRDPRAGGFGIYCILWSGDTTGRRLPAPPAGIDRPSNARELRDAITGLIPAGDRNRLAVVVVDIRPLVADAEPAPAPAKEKRKARPRQPQGEPTA